MMEREGADFPSLYSLDANQAADKHSVERTVENADLSVSILGWASYSNNRGVPPKGLLVKLQ